MSRFRRLAALVVGGTFVVLTLLERRRPLRHDVESKLRRMTRNLVFAGLAAATVNLLERPIVEPLAGFVARRRLGLLYAWRLRSISCTTSTWIWMRRRRSGFMPVSWPSRFHGGRRR
jgi:hypothetical protein